MEPTAFELTGYVPGALGRITELHGAYYAQHWKMGLYFEAKVATEFAAFLLRFDPTCDGVWFAHANGQIVGSVVIDGHDAKGEGARLRWFMIDPAYHGMGLGHRFLSEAMTFCAEKSFPRVYLTTFAGLDSARHLYEKWGFRLCREEDGTHLTGVASMVELVFEYVPEIASS